jgi:predicted DNA-binding protein with PD1-like motif
MRWKRVIQWTLFVALVLLTVDNRSMPSQSQATLPEGYVRLTQPTPVDAVGNTTQDLVSTGKVYQVGFRTGDEVMSGLAAWAQKNKVTSAYITGVGGFASATFGWVDPQVRGGLKKIEVRNKVEVSSFVGNLTPAPNGGASLHIHALVTGGDGVAKGGHLIEAQVSPIMDVFVTALAPAASR